MSPSSLRRAWRFTVVAAALGACNLIDPLDDLRGRPEPDAGVAVGEDAATDEDAEGASPPFDGGDAGCADGAAPRSCGRASCAKVVCPEACATAFSPETCNDQDDNCDGEIDTGAANCPKTAGAPAGTRCGACLYSVGRIYVGDAAVVTTAPGDYTTRKNDLECATDQYCTNEAQWINAFGRRTSCGEFCATVGTVGTWTCANECTPVGACDGGPGHGLMQHEINGCTRQGKCETTVPSAEMSNAWNMRCCCKRL